GERREPKPARTMKKGCDDRHELRLQLAQRPDDAVERIPFFPGRWPVLPADSAKAGHEELRRASPELLDARVIHAELGNGYFRKKAQDLAPHAQRLGGRLHER